MDSIILILRIIAALVGIVSLYMWYFFREEEERKAQNNLDTLWLIFDQQRGSVISSHVAVMQSAAKVMTRMLNDLLGKKLLSLRSISVSCCLAFTSVLILILLSILLTETPEKAGSSVWTLYLAIIGMLLVAFLPSVFDKAIWLTVLTDILIVLFVLAGDIGELFIERTTLGPIFVTTSLTLLPSIACTILVFAAERRLLRWGSGLKTSRKIVGTLFLNVCIGFGIVLLPILISVQLDIRFLLTLPILNTFTLILPLVCILLALLMGLHKIIWEVLDRPLYNATRFKIVENKKLLAAMGIALIGFAAWPKQYGIAPIMKALGIPLN